tara:strand:- start:51769 stop:54201 length:2433 start_codon:yes stop_codon:yes gene_type:complete
MASHAPDALAADALGWWCNPEKLGFQTTADLPKLDTVIGQPRVVSAIRYAIQSQHPGYNIYALGSEGLGKQTVIRQFLEDRASKAPPPPDYCYVSNFAEFHAPEALQLPAGRGHELREDMSRFVADCRAGLQAAFEGDEYRTRRRVIEEALKEKNEAAIEQVEHDANERNVALVRTPVGLALAPMKDGQVIVPDVFAHMEAADRERFKGEMEHVQGRLQEALQQAPRWFNEVRAQIRELNNETAGYAVDHLIGALRQKYSDLGEVVDYLDAVRADVIENVEVFLQADQHPADQSVALADGGVGAMFRRYHANLIVDSSERPCAPVIYEDNPLHDRLVGRIEHRAELGALVTDFSMIRPGALHRANGGYLILDARKVLSSPLSWEALKGALKTGEIRIETLARTMGLSSTVTLDPEPIPLDVKVVLIGDRFLYYMLSAYDPEFEELFKIAADFDETIDRTDEAVQLYARMIGTVGKQNGLRPFSADAVARVLEDAARHAHDSEKLSLHIETLGDLLREADYQAGEAGRDIVDVDAVEAAVAAQIYRADRVHQLMQREIVRGTIMIDTDGAQVGQINGLAVVSTGRFPFGRPNRISARIRLGRGEVVDIEREVLLGGPLHSKGVLILQGYLAAHFARDVPLSLAASLVFEQSYGGVDGDSASSAELYALLSAISDVPLSQSLAVTGSVNQNGDVQAIGGVNEKIEGFFDVCATRGLTGKQGVLIPAANVVHLMLDRRVRDAVAKGDFHVYPVSTIEQGLEILSGIPAGVRDAEGKFPDGSVNARVDRCLRAFAEERAKFGRTANSKSGNSDE